MSKVSTFITEMEAERIIYRRINKIAWIVQFASLIIFMLSVKILNSTDLIGLATAGLVIAVAGLISGYVLHSHTSQYRGVN